MTTWNPLGAFASLVLAIAVTQCVSPSESSGRSSPPSSSSTASAAASPAGRPMLTAYDLYDSIGVNVHFTYGGDLLKTTALLADLGVRHVRSNMGTDFDAVAAAESKTIFEKYGIDTDLIVSPGSSTALMTRWKEAIGPGQVMLENFNEPDDQAKPFDAPATIAMQKTLWSLVHGPNASPAFAGMTVIGPSILTCAGTLAFGDQAALMDDAVIHRYMIAWPPEVLGWGGLHCGSNVANGSLDQAFKTTNQKMPGTPAMMTESGYCDERTFNCTPDAATVAYEPRIFTYNLSGKDGPPIRRTFLYQIYDNSQSYGLADKDYVRKPMFGAVKWFVAHVRDTRPAIALARGRYELTMPQGGANEVTALPFEYSDGSHGLAIYSTSLLVSVNEHGCGDPRGCPLTVAPIPFTLRLDRPTGGTISKLAADGTASDTAIDARSGSMTGAATPYMQLVRWRSR